MSDYFIGEIRMFSFNFAPNGWAQCNGQILPLRQNQALYSLLGFQFGGDGSSTFALPDLRSRTPFGGVPTVTPPLVTGNAGGAETVTLSTTQIPAHIHPPIASTNAGDTVDPTNGIMAASSMTGNGDAMPNAYAPASTTPIPLAAGIVVAAGGGQAHSNIQPYTTVDFCISLNGIYPPRP